MDNQNFQSQMPNQGGFAPAPAANNTKKYITIGAVVAIVVALVIVLISCFVTTPKSLVKSYIKATYKPDFKKAESLQLCGGEKYYEYLADEANMDVDEYYEQMSNGKASNYKEYIEYRNEWRKDWLEDGTDDLGENIKLSKIEIKKDKKLSEKKLKEIKKRFKDFDYIDADKITDAHEVKFKITEKGSEDSDSDIDTITVVKYKGSWKILE